MRGSVVALLFVCAGAVAQDAVDVGTRRELMVDRALIARLEGAALRAQRPSPAGAVLAFDAPWEGRYCGYVTVLEGGAGYRMYYRGLPEAGKDGSPIESTCVAESADGMAWSKPRLGLFELMGTRENNAVLAGMAPFSHNFAPFLDTRPGVPPAERYKAVAGTSDTGLHAFVSEDGLHWGRRGDAPILTQGAFDSQNVAFWSEHEGLYVCYFRTWSEGEWAGYRTVSRSTSPDFAAWSAPVPMEFGGAPMEHLYTNQTLPCPGAPHLYVALAARFMPGRRVVPHAIAETLGIEGRYDADCSDGVLMTSRGGTRYDRTFMEGYLRPGIGAEHWTSRTNYPARGIVPSGADEWSIYVQAAYGQPAAHVVRYTIRPYGFAAVEAPYAGGTMTTHPLRFAGSALYLNFATSAAGGLRVGLMDASGAPLPGYAAGDCDELVGNELDRPVTWRGRSELPPTAAQPLRLHFEMRDALLYQLQFR